MDTVKLSIKERERTGDGPARRLRAEGRVPGVLYGKGIECKAISVALEDIKEALLRHGHNVVLELDLERETKAGETKGAKGGARKRKAALQYAVVKELQFHPTKRHLLHVDLHKVDLAEEIEASVPIELVGTPAGVADGGVVDWEHREVTVRALPSGMPESIPLDVSGLHIGNHLSVEALRAPEGVKIIDDPQTIVVALVPPRVVVEAAPAAAEAVEPEVVGGAKSEG
jgi:large subunit ribosomal protein L25